MHQKTHRKCLLNDNNDGTFSIKGQYIPKRPRSSNAIVVSRDPLDPDEPPMAPIRSHRQIQLEKLSGQQTKVSSGGDDKDGSLQHQTGPTLGPHDSESSAVYQTTSGTSKASVVIPDSLDMATEFRRYSQWPGKRPYVTPVLSNR